MTRHRITPDPSKAKPVPSASHIASQMTNGESQAGELVLTNEGQPTTTSRIVAAHFGKRHKNVLQSLETIIQQMDDPEFTGLNFQLSEYTDSTGRKLPEWFMSEQGFAMLALAFTGKKAVALRLQFVKAFADATRRIRELERKQADPGWLAARQETKDDHRLIGLVLQATRARDGKESTEKHHFMNEAKLIRHAMTGSVHAELCRSCLGVAGLRVLAAVQKLNAQLLIAGEEYQLRKARCRLFAVEQLEKLERLAGYHADVMALSGRYHVDSRGLA